MAGCLRCGGTGSVFICDDEGNIIGKEPCDCGIQETIVLPTSLKVPTQYQDIRFSKYNLKTELQEYYGSYIENLIKEITNTAGQLNKNILICAPPNSGKTVMAYTVIGQLFFKDVRIPEVLDLMQVRDTLMARYNVDERLMVAISTAPIMFIKIPMDVPNRFAETMSTIVERRVRANGSTIFLFNGSNFDLEALDTFGKYKRLLGDGSFNSILLKDFGGSNNASS